MTTTTGTDRMRKSRALAAESEGMGPHTYRKRIAKLETLQAATLEKLRKERDMRITLQDALRQAEQEVHRLTRQNRELWARVDSVAAMRGGR